MFRFESPWCLLLLLLPAVLWWRRCHRKARQASLRYSSIRLAVASGRSWRQKLLWLPLFCGDAAIVLLVVALARPQAGNERVRDVSEGIAIEMVLDRSGSMGQNMEFEGAACTRLEAVKEVFRRFVFGDGGMVLTGRPNDLIGMIVFARYADTTCPLTLSHGVLKPFLETVALADESEDGTAIGDALALGIARLHTADETMARQMKKNTADYHLKSKVLILLTDGENNFGRDISSVTELARTCGVRVHVIGISGDYMTVQTPFGRRRIPVQESTLDIRELEQLAEKTGGTFRKAASAEELLSIYGEIDKLERSNVESIRFVDYKELFQPLALAALSLIVIRIVLEASVFRRIP